MFLGNFENKITNFKFSRRKDNIVIFNTFFKELNKTKSMINNYKENFIWDYAKKIGNKHELIFITGKFERRKSISAYHPISRSFFKLHEIIKEFNMEFSLSDEIVSVHLAEGPGGFMETLCYSCPHN